MDDNNLNKFFNWLTEPMKQDEVDAWYRANNITPELNILFKDFCFSLYYLVRDTYLGDNDNGYSETKIGLTEEQKMEHFKWCWDKTIENFKKENINFKIQIDTFNYFSAFFSEVFYNQKDDSIKEGLEDFFKQLFDRKRIISKSDIEMYTDLYKTLERSLMLI